MFTEIWTWGQITDWLLAVRVFIYALFVAVSNPFPWFCARWKKTPTRVITTIWALLGAGMLEQIRAQGADV